MIGKKDKTWKEVIIRKVPIDPDLQFRAFMHKFQMLKIEIQRELDLSNARRTTNLAR